MGIMITETVGGNEFTSTLAAHIDAAIRVAGDRYPNHVSIAEAQRGEIARMLSVIVEALDYNASDPFIRKLLNDPDISVVR